MKQSPTESNYKSKLNSTMPKSQAGYWNENKVFMFERNNVTIKVKGSSPIMKV